MWRIQTSAFAAIGKSDGAIRRASARIASGVFSAE
jgi:hypothetical protein